MILLIDVSPLNYVFFFQITVSAITIVASKTVVLRACVDGLVSMRMESQLEAGKMQVRSRSTRSNSPVS